MNYHMNDHELQVLIEYRPGYYQGFYITGITAGSKS